MKKILVLLIISTLLLVGCSNKENSSSDVSEDTTTENKNKEMPNPKFYTLEGEEVDLASFKGKPLVLNLWASWCPPCKEELPNFNEAYKANNLEVEFACVSLVDGRNETPESAINFINENNYELPFYLDSAQQVAYAFKVTSIPVTYFINSDGTEYMKHVGLITEEQLQKRIEELIENNK